MHDIGQILIEARQKHGFELEQAARETHIAKCYLEALEADDYSIFPAEPYITGFLRNYCEYLGLEPDEIISSYKQIKLQETNPPPETLLPKNKVEISKTAIIVIGILIVALALAAGIYFLLFKVHYSVPAAPIANVKSIDTRSAKKYEITDSEEFEKRVFSGDTLSITLKDKTYVLTVKSTVKELEIDVPSLGVQLIQLGTSFPIDLDGDGIPDAKITVSDIENDEEKGAVVMITSGAMLADENAAKYEEIVVSESPANLKQGNGKVLFEGGAAYPVTLTATFRGYCLFRYEIDKTMREEKYFQKSDQRVIQANNGLRIWASNGNAVKLQLTAGGKTVDLEVSRPGEVIVKDLKWVRSEDNRRFRFMEIDID